MTQKLNRRDVLRGAALAGITAWTGGHAMIQAADRSPNEKLNIAVVGCGGQGHENLRQITSENIVALCDVDERQAGKAFEELPKARRFRDFRKLLDEMHREIDAVVVSTPDHMHAPISLAAMRLGKHVYCEKPLTWSVEEARLMAATAQRNNVATQMGTQGMAEDRSRAGIEVVRSGVLGKVKEIHVWTDRAAGWWPQGVERPQESQPVPKGLDWDLWLGVAKERPYHSIYCPFKWRGWKDFGTGSIGDMGIHNAAMISAGLRLGKPGSVEILDTSGLKQETYPFWATLRYEFPESKLHGPVTLYWYEGGKKPSAELIGGRELAKNGAIAVGSKATMYSIEWTGGDWHLLPEEKFRDYKLPEPTIARAPKQSHHQDWFRACKGGTPALCNFIDFAAPLTETMLVGALALRLGKNIRWNAASVEAQGCPEAEPWIRREYRKGWSVRGH